MANKFFEGLGGVITLLISGKNQERIINLALSRGIYIWDIKWQGEKLHLRIRSSAFQALQSIADENSCELEILSKRGLPFIKTLLRRRMGFLGGAAIFVLALYLMSLFVWFIDISGNQKLDSTKILQSATRNGLFRGAAKWNFSSNEVERAMLRELPRLSYVQCEIQGVKVHIRVVEKIWPDEQITGPCHIVAVRDGVVEDILILEGQAKVNTGQVISKGDILISGIVYPAVPEVVDENTPLPENEPSLVRARGVVKARTWYEGYGECPRQTEQKVYNGKQTKALYLKTPWNEICLKKDQRQKALLYKQENKHMIINTPLGRWGIYIKQWREQERKVHKYSEAQALQKAREKGIENLRKKLPKDIKISDSHIELLSSPSDSMVRIKVSIECIEDISQVQPIDETLNSN